MAIDIEVWDMDNKTVNNVITGFTTNRSHLLFTNDNLFLCFLKDQYYPGEDKPFEIWRLNDNQLVRYWDGHIPDVFFVVKGYNIIFSFSGGLEELDSRKIIYQWDLLNK